ncbi:hypothetical protein AX15_000523 [Amanita polypyramis BW_CC]|nr:hypothetical protein AX15_000523 [Amanita polypyramis BW_CC]
MPCPTLMFARFLISTPRADLLKKGLKLILCVELRFVVIEHAKKVWPAPPRIPKGGWSSTWEHWPYLLTFYWFSPYFLMIPQIDMIANILYRLPGETRPILFSNSRNQFVFTLLQDSTRFFLYDVNKQTLHEFDAIADEENLVEKMDEDPEVLPLRTLLPDTEGEDAIRRILERDETVLPLLAENFLDYTPEITEQWQEDPMASQLVSNQERDELCDAISDKVETAAKEGRTELTEEEQWDIIKQVTAELDRRRNDDGARK